MNIFFVFYFLKSTFINKFITFFGLGKKKLEKILRNVFSGVEKDKKKVSPKPKRPRFKSGRFSVEFPIFRYMVYMCHVPTYMLIRIKQRTTSLISRYVKF